MYYPTVNRGLRFTKPGVYAFGFLLAVGMIAIATGINGLYIFLSAGLGGFIVSGLLSERAMKNCSVKSVNETVVPAGESFTLSFELANSSSSYAAHAIKTCYLPTKPGFRLLAGKINADATHYLGSLQANEVQICATSHVALVRGRRKSLLVMQLTTFPFGMLEKFKFADIDANLIVTPAIDKPYYQQIRDLARHLKSAADADKEFFSHKPFTTRDTTKTLDWKKSAGRQPQAWVTKVYRSINSDGPVIVEADWNDCVRSGDEASYESYLSRIQTACRAISDEGLAVALEMRPWGRLHDLAAIGPMLASLPMYKDRADPSFLTEPKEFLNTANLSREERVKNRAQAVRVIISSDGKAPATRQAVAV